MPQADSIFACRNIQEIPREKVVAYARALQYWAEQNNLPARSEPHLLVRSILELREEVRWYLSFTDKEVFKGVPLPEEEEEESLQTPGPTDLPEAPPVCELVPENEPQSLWDGRRYCTHPGQWWPLGTSLDLPEPQGQR